MAFITWRIGYLHKADFYYNGQMVPEREGRGESEDTNILLGWMSNLGKGLRGVILGQERPGTENKRVSTLDSLMCLSMDLLIGILFDTSFLLGSFF